MNILLVVIIIIILYFVFSWYFGGSDVTLSKMADGKTGTIVPASKLVSNSGSNNFTYSMWVYVNDWNYRYGEEKVLVARLNSDTKPSPAISLGTVENNVIISISTYQNSVPPASTSTAVTPDNTSQVNTYYIRNIQLQKWVNIIVSVYGRTMDVYLDGKLVRTFVLPGVAKISASSNAYITPGGGFDGMTSNFRYWSNATNPQQAYDIYKSGFGGSVLGNLFNKYRLKISIIANNIEDGSIEI